MDNREDPLIKRDHAAIVATALTMAGALLAYMINVAIQLDARLDRLEEDAKVLIGEDGRIAPAREALEAHYGVKALEARLALMETLVHRR